MKYKITKDKLWIINANGVSKKHFDRVLAGIENLHPKSFIWKRGRKSLKREWCFLNAFHSKSPDFEFCYPQKHRIVRSFLGVLLWPLTK